MKTFSGLKLDVGDTLIQICVVQKEMKTSENGTMNWDNFYRKKNILSFRDILSKSKTHTVLQHPQVRVDSWQKEQHLKQVDN